jgi:hypothetical protein
MIDILENQMVTLKMAVLGFNSPVLGFILGFNLKPKQRWTSDKGYG